MGLPSKYFRVVVIIIHFFSTPKLPQKTFWSTIHYPAGAAAGSCILRVSFFFLATRIFHILPNIRFWPNLDQSGQFVDHYSGTNDDGVKGHVGVTGVKKEVKKGSIFTKKESTPTDYVALTRDLCICISWTPSTKVMVVKNNQGSFGVTGVKSKNVIHTVWKIWKYLQNKNWSCHVVDNSQSFKKVNGDLVIRPHLKGSKIKMYCS